MFEYFHCLIMLIVTINYLLTYLLTYLIDIGHCADHRVFIL